jgi:hypothetical protein
VTSLEAASREIKDPVEKLRFIRGSLARYRTLDQAVRKVPWAPARHVLYRWLSLEGLRHLLNPNAMGSAPVLSGPARGWLIASRAAAVLAVSAIAGGAVAGAYRMSRPAASAVLAAPAAPHASVAAVAVPDPAAAPAPSLVPAGVAPAGVWMVERGPTWEQFSNGLRIDTTFATSGTARRFRVFDEAGRLEEAVRDRPVGILFHTSESDVWPLEAAFNENLRDSSQRLLKYVQKNRLYHYVIDRFGRVYRVVEEEAKANHAGHSVWADGGRVYLNLNHAFLAVSFETRWEGGQALPITQAQFAAGRNLSDYLRQRYEITPGMCVTHGLTSVNPKKRLIGHHLDWARGFPFEAFGLPDQYRRPAPSVALFGFGYDEDFLKVLPEPWDGVRAAEKALEKEAAARMVGLDVVRDERREAYDRWIAEQARDDQPALQPNGSKMSLQLGGVRHGRAEGPPVEGGR